MAERAGHRLLTVQGAIPRDADFKQHLCADIVGFSLHAAVRCGAEDRQALQQLCRCITRPAPANERVQTKAAGQLLLELKTARRDGPAGRAWPMARSFARHKESTGLFVSGLSTTHLAMSPLEFMQRLATHGEGRIRCAKRDGKSGV